MASLGQDCVRFTQLASLLCQSSSTCLCRVGCPVSGGCTAHDVLWLNSQLCNSQLGMGRGALRDSNGFGPCQCGMTNEELLGWFHQWDI